MSRFGKKDGPRHKPSSDVSSKKQRGPRLTALLTVVVMIGVSATILGTWETASAVTSTTVQIPVNPVSVEDPCGPDNAVWQAIPVDADTLEFDFHTGGANDDHIIVDIQGDHPDLQFPDGTRTHDYGTAPDSGVACAPEPTIVDVPANPGVNDPCNPAGVTDNVTWKNVADNGTYHYAVLDNGDLRVTIVADNTTFADESTSHDYTKPADSGVACDTGGGHNGDNGTVKTHKVGTSTSDVKDEPKVGCQFYVDAFFFDGVQVVNYHIVTGTHGDTVLSGTITLDENGHGFTDTLNLPEGKYKLYWNFDGEHGAAKHKVFKVEGDCGNNPPPPPPPPKFHCPDGSIPADVNHDGVLDKSDCEVIIIDHGKPKHHKPSKCANGHKWLDANNNGVVDKGECVPTAAADTGLGDDSARVSSSTGQSLLWLGMIPAGLLMMMTGGFGLRYTRVRTK